MHFDNQFLQTSSLYTVIRIETTITYIVIETIILKKKKLVKLRFLFVRLDGLKSRTI